MPVARLPSGSWINMPVVVVHGVKPGPTVWLSGAIHGDELNGVEIVRRLLKRIDPKTLRGTVLGVPIVNVFGVTMGSRYLPDRRDLNRSFPGSSKGSMAARVAHLFFERVASRCRVGIDFHTGSAGRSNLPQLRCDLSCEETRRLAGRFGPPVMIDSKLRDGSLRASAHKAGIRVLLYEAGEALRFDEPAIQLGVDGTLRVLAALKMLKEAPTASRRRPMTAEKSTWLRAGRSGFCQFHTDLGARVNAGDRVATVSDSIGEKENSVKCRTDGVVIGILRSALVHRGEALIHIAELG